MGTTLTLVGHQLAKLGGRDPSESCTLSVDDVDSLSGSFSAAPTNKESVPRRSRFTLAPKSKHPKHILPQTFWALLSFRSSLQHPRNVLEPPRKLPPEPQLARRPPRPLRPACLGVDQEKRSFKTEEQTLSGLDEHCLVRTGSLVIRSNEMS